jgi:glycosyltransferase involved in cell wall biosynthesis
MSRTDKRVSVAQIITRLDWGGSPDIIRILCSSLDPEKFNVTLITGISLNQSHKTKEFLQKYREKVISISPLRRDINPVYDFLALFSLYRLFRKEKFDIVHTHTAKAGILGRIAARLAGIPRVIHTPHGHNFYGYFGSLGSKAVIHTERIMSKLTHKIIALTELEKRDLAVYHVALPSQVAVVNSGLELDHYRAIAVDTKRKKEDLHIREDAVVVGMVGRLEPVKGPEYFVEAADMVLKKHPNITFLIVGDGSLYDSLKAQCSRMHISDSLIFTGWREDIPELLTMIDLLVLPSLNEAVGRILIEAGACGKPVVATRVGGIPEVVLDNKTGVLVPPRDAAEMARAIMVLAEDKKKRVSMGETAKNWVDEKFSAPTMVESIADLYHELIRDGSPKKFF